MKVLYWDREDLAIWYRRLGQGTFQVPLRQDSASSFEIRSDEFTMLLRGIELSIIRQMQRERNVQANRDAPQASKYDLKSVILCLTREEFNLL